jgi:hypothetical protein
VLTAETRARVEHLLGGDHQQGKEYWHYLLGPERSLFSLDSEYLVVRFGQDQRVRAVRIQSG